MSARIKVLVTKKQAKKLEDGKRGIILQIRRSKGEPLIRYRAMLTGLELEREPYISANHADLHGGAFKRPADALYEDALRKVMDVIGHDGSTERLELKRAGMTLLGSKLRGVFSNSEAPDALDDGEMALVNTGEPGAGEHWLAIAHDPAGDVVYDSLGGTKHGMTDPDAEQDADDEDCGQRALAWLLLVDTQGVDTGMDV